MAENVKAVKGPGMNAHGPRPKVDNAGENPETDTWIYDEEL